MYRSLVQTDIPLLLVKNIKVVLDTHLFINLCHSYCEYKLVALTSGKGRHTVKSTLIVFQDEFSQ